MKRVVSLLMIAGALALMAYAAGTTHPAMAQPGGAPPPGGPRPGGPPPGMAPGAPIDSFVARRDSLTKLVLEDIAGKENMPAESVFKKIEVLKGLPAGRLLRTMNAFGRSLGVSCEHCHIANHWADDDKKTKGIARDMMKMAHAINEDYLGKMQGLDQDHASVGCFTCHRGERRPGRMQPPPGQAPPAPGQPPGR